MPHTRSWLRAKTEPYVFVLPIIKFSASNLGNSWSVSVGVFVCLNDFLQKEEILDEINECKGDHVDSVWQGPAHIIECGGEGMKVKG